MITSSDSPISFFYDQNTEVHYQEPPFILISPSSFDDNESPLCQIFSRNDVPMATDHQEINKKNVSSGKKIGSELEMNGVIKPLGRSHASAPCKRTGKKDRHSKISTAQGVRERRMRLSLPTARKFFDLQDMLGLDKASNTIEWLLSKSRKDIEKLLITNHLPPIKHSYLISSDDDGGEEKINETLKQGEPDNEEVRDEIIMNEKEGGPKSGKVMENHHNAKEARAKARARARERTREKMKAQISKLWYDLNPTNNNNLDQPFSAIDFYDSQNGAVLESHAHTIEHIYENLGSFDDSISLMQMDNNNELSVLHGLDCSYTNNGFNRMLENWDSNGTRMNPSSCATSNIESFSGNHPPSFRCLPSKEFPFSLQY